MWVDTHEHGLDCAPEDYEAFGFDDEEGEEGEEGNDADDV